MRFTVHYIPLHKIRPAFSVKITDHIRKLRGMMWDCMHLLVVRKNKKNDQYEVISGFSRYDHLMKHTSKKYAPCIIEESKINSNFLQWLDYFRSRKLLDLYPDLKVQRLRPGSLTIIRSFLKQEPRFFELSRSQQLKVLLLAIRYRKTMVITMRAQVEQMLKKSI